VTLESLWNRALHKAGFKSLCRIKILIFCLWTAALPWGHLFHTALSDRHRFTVGDFLSNSSDSCISTTFLHSARHKTVQQKGSSVTGLLWVPHPHCAIRQNGTFFFFDLNLKLDFFFLYLSFRLLLTCLLFSFLHSYLDSTLFIYGN
jgi:hypothetical protein